MIIAVTQKIRLPWIIDNCNIFLIWGKKKCFCANFKNFSMCHHLFNSIFSKGGCRRLSDHKGANVLHKFLCQKKVLQKNSSALAACRSGWCSSVLTFPARRKYIIDWSEFWVFGSLLLEFSKNVQKTSLYHLPNIDGSFVFNFLDLKHISTFAAQLLLVDGSHYSSQHSDTLVSCLLSCSTMTSPASCCRPHRWNRCRSRRKKSGADGPTRTSRTWE